MPSLPRHTLHEPYRRPDLALVSGLSAISSRLSKGNTFSVGRCNCSERTLAASVPAGVPFDVSKLCSPGMPGSV